MTEQAVAIDWEIIRPSIEKLCETMLGPLTRGHVFRLASQGQATPAANSLAEWFSSGKPDTPPGLSDASVRASIYNQSLVAHQASAFCHVSRSASYEHAKAVLMSLDSGSAVVPLALIRGLIERAALAESLRAKLSGPFFEIAKEEGYHEALRETDLMEVIGKSLYGTKIDWHKLTEVNFEKAKARDLNYRPKDQFLDVSANQILNNVDKLGKKVPGCRLAYDVLCEFLHPNVGDLFAATTRATVTIDGWGTRHLRREFSLGQSDFSGAHDLINCLNKALTVSRSVVELLPGVHSELERYGKELILLNQKSMHRVRKKQKHLFRGKDLCPCLSGRKVKDCR